ncbi:hypothetical protein [Streptomyces platensis]
MSPYAVDAYWSTLAQHDPDRGHDRLAAALAEGGRPPVQRLNREGLPELHALLAEPELRAYEERIAALQRQRDGGDPLAPSKIANEGRRWRASCTGHPPARTSPGAGPSPVAPPPGTRSPGSMPPAGTPTPITDWHPDSDN